MPSQPPVDSGVPDREIPPLFGDKASADAAMTYFYGRLSASDPEIRAMFPPTMAAQRRRMYAALCRICAGTRGTAPERGTASEAGDADDKLAGYLETLGRAHRKFGVRPEHYDTFLEALEATLRRYPPDEEQWPEPERIAALRRTAEIMTAAAEKASGPAWWTAEVVEAELRTPYVAVLSLRPDQPYPYLAGQHATVQTPHWPRVWRNYSIANAPGDGDGTLTLHVRVVPGGLVSTALLHAGQGDTVLLGPAEGAMTADTASPRDALCIGGGTGLAPVKAVAEALAARPRPDGGERGVALYFGARTEADLYDLPALRAMERDRPSLEVHLVTSEERSPRALHGTVANLAADAAGQDRDVYIGGPDAMIVHTVERLLHCGVPAERLHYDLPEYAVAP